MKKKFNDGLPQAVIQSISGIPTLEINGEPFPPFAYMSYLGEAKFYQEAAKTGIHLFCFPAYLGDRGINTRSGIGPFRSGLWRDEKEFDFSDLITDFDKILQADPKALVIIRLHLDPPGWWKKNTLKRAASCRTEARCANVSLQKNGVK